MLHCAQEAKLKSMMVMPVLIDLSNEATANDAWGRSLFEGPNSRGAKSHDIFTLGGHSTRVLVVILTVNPAMRERETNKGSSSQCATTWIDVCRCFYHILRQLQWQRLRRQRNRVSAADCGHKRKNSLFLFVSNSSSQGFLVG